MMQAMFEMPEPEIQGLAFLLLHEETSGRPLRAGDSFDQVQKRLDELPSQPLTGTLLQGLFKSTPSQFKGDLFRIASVTCDSQAASLLLDEMRENGLHAGVCARALLSEALGSEKHCGPERSYNALVLAAALSSPTSAQHSELLIATIVQLCAPLREDASHQTLSRSVERASSTVKRAFDRLIMTSADSRVRERLVPLLSLPALRRPARACLESCVPGILNSACAFGGHRLKSKGRLDLLCNSAIALQFQAGLKNKSSYSQQSSSLLFDCMAHSDLSGDDLIDALELCACSNSSILKWKAETTLLRLSPSSRRDELLRQIARLDQARNASYHEPLDGATFAVDELQEFVSDLSVRPEWWLGARARIILDSHPDAFQALLRRTLRTSQGKTLLAALQVIRRCELGSSLESELIGLADNEKDRLSGSHRCELVRIFSKAQSSQGAAYILRCTVDADARVQATVLSVLAGINARDLGGIFLDPRLLERIACTADRAVRRAALRALRFRSPDSFEALMNTLLCKDSVVSPELFLDAASFSGRPVIPGVLRLLESDVDEKTSESGTVTLRTMRAQRGPWNSPHAGEVAV